MSIPRATVLLMLVLTQQACNAEPSGNGIIFLVPQDYVGRLVVIPSSSAPAPTQTADGRYEIKFNEKGIAEVPDLDFFNQWREIVARYPDGQVIKMLQRSPSQTRVLEALTSNEKAINYQIK